MGANADKSFAILMREANRFPTLTVEREQELARNWHQTGDSAAIHELVGSHLKLVIKVARGLAGYGLPLVDLVAEGNVGLMRAAARFDPDRGFRFSTYAIWWVRASMQEYVLQSWSLVKIGTTATQKKLFFNLRRLKAGLHELDNANLSGDAVSAIAADLDVTADDVIDMNCRLSGRDDSLNATPSSDVGTEWLDFLADQRPSQEEIVGEHEEARARRDLMNRAVASLNTRERVILVERRLRETPPTLDELSHRFSVSNERIRQIELRAVEKLRIAILATKNKRQFEVPAAGLKASDGDRRTGPQERLHSRNPMRQQADEQSMLELA
jgi:RNA polymerase sigma-32 factor